ncbi:conserved hypothetical protein [Brevundimonas subvibrioides ATCC 15264]|uniref:Uncharacterized protein n=1 Tax=Brevundimonas subvibrioides (strain ATCC 15264 / DSM 4735 / LMG 14903 / NBRC 16000 / CB 81) TaxID=633149 RepID=D9QJ07_BRESC|nr:conserved hypothetical protein [Brevundimonas subvibrioides ATCC 15264]
MILPRSVANGGGGPPPGLGFAEPEDRHCACVVVEGATPDTLLAFAPSTASRSPSPAARGRI